MSFTKITTVTRKCDACGYWEEVRQAEDNEGTRVLTGNTQNAPLWSWIKVVIEFNGAPVNLDLCPSCLRKAKDVRWADVLREQIAKPCVTNASVPVDYVEREDPRALLEQCREWLAGKYGDVPDRLGVAMRYLADAVQAVVQAGARS